jgi:hypothetical protein
MNSTTITVVFVIFLLAILYMRSEGFTSPGTMVQLASSHVPTEEDVYYERFLYPEIVRKEITRMTGDDPGPQYPMRWSRPFYVTL